MLIIAGTVRVPPARVAWAKSAMADMIAASRAEPGCRAYAYAEDVLEPGLIHVHEIWESRAALTAHFQTPHMQAWRGRWSELEISDRQLSLYEVGSAEPI
jgi:quinol monooxygenase YgiN